MTPLVTLHERPLLDEPVLVIALDGWIDAGLGAGAALGRLQAATEWRTVATFDADELLDHRARRPTMNLRDGVVTELRWPAIELAVGTDERGADVVLLSGAEPDHRWGAFADAVVDLALDLGVRAVHGLGAYPAPVPHTRPSKVVATAATPELAAAVGAVPGQIEVPAGIAAAIEERAAEAGVAAAGLWAQVPHYAATMPYPAAGVALLATLDRVAEVRFDPGPLVDDAVRAHERIESLIDGNPEHVAMVRQLESQVDSEIDAVGLSISGDELAAELEQFLRDETD